MNSRANSNRDGRDKRIARTGGPIPGNWIESMLDNYYCKNGAVADALFDRTKYFFALIKQLGYYTRNSIISARPEF